MDEVKSYRLSPAFFQDLRHRAWIVSFSLVLTGIAASLYAGLSDSNLLGPDPLFFIACVVLVLIVNVFRTARHLKNASSSFQLVLDQNSMARHRDGLADVQLSPDTVSRIVEYPQGLELDTIGAKGVMFIPNTVEEYSTIKARLSNWSVIEQKAPTVSSMVWDALMMSAIALTWIGLFAFRSAYIVVPSALLYLGWRIWRLIERQRSKYVDKKARRISWDEVLLMLLIVGRMVFVILMECR